MKDKVKDAIRNIETDLMYGDPFALDAVSRHDVEILLAYGKKRLKKSKNRTTELTVGDTVKTLVDVPGASVFSGEVGKLSDTREHSLGFEWGVQFPSRVARVYFKREELEKLN